MAVKRLSEYTEEWSGSPWDFDEICYHIKKIVDPQEEIVPHINRYLREKDIILNKLKEAGYEFG